MGRGERVWKYDGVDGKDGGCTKVVLGGDVRMWMDHVEVWRVSY